MERGKSGEAGTLEEFVSNEEEENSGEHVQRLFECMKLADYTITNNENLETLFEHITEIIRKEGLEHQEEIRGELKHRPR